MNSITIDWGLFTELEVDLSDFDFAGVSKVLFSVRNKPGDELIITREFSTAAIHALKVTPEESRLLNKGAQFDFAEVTIDGETFKLTDNGDIIIRRGVTEVD